MLDPKTIEIDEIVTPDKPPGDDASACKKKPTWSKSGEGQSRPEPPSENPFSDFQKALPWKARITLKLTQWFILLRSKSWGKWIIVPAILLAITLAIPVGLIGLCFLIIRSFLRSFTRP